MTNIPDHIYDLIIQSFQESLTSSDKEILDNWITEAPENNKAFQDMYTIWLSGNMINISKGKDNAWNKVYLAHKKSKIISLNWKWVSVAASIIVILSVLGGVRINQRIQNERWNKLNALAKVSNDVKLVTQSGKEIILSDTIAKNIQIEGDELENENNMLTYKVAESKKVNTEPAYHELIVPKGRIYTLALSDGSIITLNSESSIKFPTSFTANTRDVWVNGEVYFQVAHDKSKPFIVHSKDFDTQVLGTQFNVRSYDNENLSTVTLVKGSVQLISPENRTKMLTPGYQFSLLENQDFSESEIKKVSTYNVTAWRDGIMFFDNMKLEDFLICLSRWYDFDYAFTDEALKTKLYTGGIKKTDDLKKIFSLIEKVNDVEFSIKNNQILISKK